MYVEVADELAHSANTTGMTPPARFIDGTVFNLSGGTQIALDEFGFGSNGGSHSALFSVATGTF